ncbi:extracellular solute-binding protein [Alteribacter populi]|uniref:extracellular solute-binding protein n=1 Tax=Alteribacter populi TaxID=2011011 RepID=UPI000BBB0F9A|nr:extracellular solute-binding protein [Alteribacter populi]
MEGKKLSTYRMMFCLAMMLILVSGCSDAETGGEESSGDETLDISMALNFDGTEAPSSGSDVEAKLEELTNTELDITHMVSANFCDRLPVLIASGDLPDVIASCGPPNQSYLLSAMQDDVFWEIGEYLDQFPTLASMADIVYENVSINEELYGIPRYRPLSRFVTVYRQDWLDNLGLEEPTNFDEFVDVMRAFTFDDPNQSGEDDTRGYTSVSLPGQFGFDFGLAHGSPHMWDVDESGNFTKDHETEEFLEGLKFSRQVFEEGLVNSDIVAPDRSAREADFENGVSGMWAASSNNVLSIEAALKSNEPDAELGVYNALEGPVGDRRLPSQMGSNGILMFPRASVESEEHLLQLLGFFEEIASNQEVIDLFAWGIEGEHYELNDGVPEHIDYDKYMNAVGYPYRYPLVTAPIEESMTQGQLSELAEYVLELEAENDELVVTDPAINLVSETENQMGADLEQLINDAKFQFVTGEIDEDQWWEAVETWKDRGGDQVRAELEEQYKELN